MRFKLVYLLPAMALFAAQCTGDKKNNEQAVESSWIKPEAGSAVKLGDKVLLQIQPSGNQKIDSVVYLADGKKLTSGRDAKEISISTDSMLMGNRLITAKIYRAGQAEEISTNIVLHPARAPQKFSYQVQQVFNHDTSSYTQGLEFHSGYFYESDGGNTPEIGQSSLRRVEPASGKVVQKLDISKDIFAEGITLVGNKIIQLTWQNNIGLVYDKDTFKALGTFPYQNSREGWGLCFDGKRIYKTDGSNLIYFLNKDNYKEEGYIEVYDQNGPVDQLNELEYIDGKIYANVYQTDRIVIIDPKNGQVTGEIDMTDLLPVIYHYPNTDVLNGIAWDAKGKRLFVTGKKWAKLFQVKIVPTGQKTARNY